MFRKQAVSACHWKWTGGSKVVFSWGHISFCHPQWTHAVWTVAPACSAGSPQSYWRHRDWAPHTRGFTAYSPWQVLLWVNCTVFLIDLYGKWQLFWGGRDKKLFRYPVPAQDEKLRHFGWRIHYGPTGFSFYSLKPIFWKKAFYKLLHTPPNTLQWNIII